MPQFKPPRKRRAAKDSTSPAVKKSINSDSQHSDAEVRVIQTHPNCYKVFPPSGNKEESATDVTTENKSNDFMPNLSDSSAIQAQYKTYKFFTKFFR